MGVGMWALTMNEKNLWQLWNHLRNIEKDEKLKGILVKDLSVNWNKQTLMISKRFDEMSYWIDTRVLFTEKLATYWLIDIQTHNHKLKHFWTGCYLELSWAPKSETFYRSQDILENRSSQLMENNNLIYNLNNKIIIFKNDIFFLDATSDLNMVTQLDCTRKKVSLQCFTF